MTDQKQGARQSGFLGIFRRRQPTLPSTDVTGNSKQEETTTPPPRRAYKPRYAERDMVLSMPVEQRPDLVAKANEERLRSVCSDIGFSTTGSMHSVSSHSRVGSRNWYSRQMPTHPNLHLKLHGDSGVNAAGSSNSSFQDSVLYRSNVYRTASSSTSMRDGYTSTSHAETSNRALEQHRPVPRSYHSAAAVPQTNSTSIEAVNQAYAELGISGADFEPERASKMSAMNRDAEHPAQLGHRLSTARQSSNYFGHNEALPNLRGDKGKGKEGGSPVVTQAESSYCGDSCESQYSDDRESYVLRTAASLTLPSRAAPTFSGTHNSFLASRLGPALTCTPGHSREPSTHESSSSSVAGSFENQNSNEFWSRTDSDRNPSTSTLMTSYTESSDMMPSAAQSHTTDARDRGDNAGTESMESVNGSKHGNADQEEADDKLEYNDETPDAKAEHRIELRNDAIDNV